MSIPQKIFFTTNLFERDLNKFQGHLFSVKYILIINFYLDDKLSHYNGKLLEEKSIRTIVRPLSAKGVTKAYSNDIKRFVDIYDRLAPLIKKLENVFSSCIGGGGVNESREEVLKRVREVISKLQGNGIIHYESRQTNSKGVVVYTKGHSGDKNIFCSKKSLGDTQGFRLLKKIGELFSLRKEAKQKLFPL